MKKIFTLKILFIGFLFFVSQTVLVQANVNAGFVNGLWFSKTPFFAGEDVRVYTVIQNQSGFDIIGVVKFFVDDKLLSQSDFSLVNGRLTEEWADWKVVQGEHHLSIQISDTKKIEVGKEPENINLISNTPLSEKYNVDLDTDGDGVGDKDDLDDDDDGFSDEEEKVLGTNLLVFDKPVVTEEEVLDEKKDSNINGGEQEDSFSTDTEGIVSQALELINNAKETTKVVVDNTKDFLEKQKEKVDEELEQKKEEGLADDNPTKIDEEKNPYVASLVGSIPELKEVYSFVLAVLIYILNSWWILLGSILIILYFLWKITKRMFRRGY